MDASAIAAIATGATTLSAAVLTGFGAASLKHRWDVADDARRWAREQRRRLGDDLAQSWTGYLSARMDLESLVQRWSVATIRARATRATEAQRARWPVPPDEAELSVAGMVVLRAKEAVALRLRSEEALAELERDAEMARRYALDAIDIVNSGAPLGNLKPAEHLRSLVTADCRSAWGADVPERALSQG